MKNVNIYNVVRVDTERRKGKRDRTDVTVIGTYMCKRSAEEEFKTNLELTEASWNRTGRKFWKSVKERRIWARDFSSGCRWYILKQPLKAYAWDEDDGLLRINPK